MKNFIYCNVLLITMILAGCATERSVTPTIDTTPRTGLQLETPVLASVYDGRTNGDHQDAAKTLKTQLQKIYGDSLEWVPYFKKVPPGRIAIRLRIVKLGSQFGSRLISSVAYANAFHSAQVSATGPWGPVVGSVSSKSSVFAGSFSGEGWWNGAAWIDVEIEDNRQARYRVTIPLAAEDRESNMWGYASGDKAAREAWENVSAQLMRVMDNALRVLRDTES